MNSEKTNKGQQELFDKIKQLIQDTGQQAVVYLNQATNHLYWSIGHYILVDLKHEVYSGYGKQIIATLSQLLMLGEENIKVAQYLTQLPDKQWFIDKLHKAIAIAEEQAKTN